MANDFYTPEEAVQVAAALASEDAYLSALINRDFEDNLLGGGGKGRTVNVRIPAALTAHVRGVDAIDAIKIDALEESVHPVKLGDHVYSAVALTEGDLTLHIEDFAKQVLAPQVAAVVEEVEAQVADVLATIALDSTVAWNEADPVKTFTEIRKRLRQRGVPQTNLNVVVGTNVYAALLDAKAITDASQSASTEALREGNVGKVRGFQVVESTRVDDDEIVAFHRDAFTLAVRAPQVPAGAAFGATESSNGFSLRYLRDYDVNTTRDRSLVSTFAGVAAMPFYEVTRDRVAGTADVNEVIGGAAFRMSITDTEPVSA